MQRLLSCIRRRPGYVDLVTPRDPTAALYRLRWATNFDAAPTTFLDVSPVGYRDPAINPNVVDVQNIGDRVRIVFNPTTYSIPDTVPFWLQLWKVDGVGTATQKTAMTLVLPDSSNHQHTLVIAGQAPNATLGNGLQIDLPRQMKDVRLTNLDAAVNLLVATEEGGYEAVLKPGAAPQLVTTDGPVSSLFVRGNAAVVNFTATMAPGSPF